MMYGLKGVLVSDLCSGWALALKSSTSPISPGMFSKKPKKSHQPSQRPVSFVIPTNVALGPVGLGADLDLGIRSEGVFRSMGSSS